MANSLLSSDFYEYASVDTAPGASGYSTNSVTIRSKKGKIDGKVWFSIRGTGTMGVTVQFKCSGDSDWTDYETYNNNERKSLEGGGAGVQWRATVKQADYSSGSKSFGFDW